MDRKQAESKAMEIAGINPARIFSRLGQAEEFSERQPFFYDKYKIWWLWDKNKFKYEIVDEVDVLNLVGEEIDLDIIPSKQRTEIINALKQEGRKRIPKTPKESWLQFGGLIFDIETGEEFEASPEYLMTNPIKWELGETEETPKMDKLLSSWVGKENIQELYEILAFSIVPSYFIHRIICFIGSGANGKSTFLKLLRMFIGDDNITSTSLQALMNNRFEGSKLYKKLVCLMGETNFGSISKTEYIKGLSGEDKLRIEFKGKDGFDAVNVAKLILATNSLPMTFDKTEGWYRRWKIMKFENKFTKEEDVLSNIPEEEYNNLAFKCLNLAKKLWADRTFTNDGDFESRKKRYEEESNPLMLFIKQNYVKDINGLVSFPDFVERLEVFLESGGYRALNSVQISKQLKAEGFPTKPKTKNLGKNPDGTQKTSSEMMILGLNIDHIGNIDHKSTQNTHEKISKNIIDMDNMVNISLEKPLFSELDKEFEDE